MVVIMNNLELTEFERLPIESITIESVDINEAIELSSAIPDEDRQWQTYINALGLFTFKNWIEERDSQLIVNWKNSTISKPSFANVIPVTNLEVGNFKVCLVTVGSFCTEQIALSRLVVESPKFIPHFYVFVEVFEEQERGIVRGFITYPQLMGIATQTTLKPDWTYQIPITLFDTEINRLLLYLRALEPQAITLPAIHGETKQQLAAVETEIIQLLPQLQAPSRRIWEVLSWEQGSIVLNSPELIEWIYKLQTSPESSSNIISKIASLRDTIKIITQPAINLGRWLWNEIDEVGRALEWTLLPQLAPIRTIMRSPEEEFGAIITQLQAQGLEISPLARCGYNNVLIAGLPLRVYAAAWNLPSDDHCWSLLLILGSAPPNTLPHKLKLRVSDQTQILVEQEMDTERIESFLYTHVIGDWDEKFIASVSIAAGVEVTLPPFAFDIKI